jgi:hypothetical protein
MDTSMSTDRAVYRVRRYYRKSELPKKYGGTFEMVDDNAQQVMAVCDVIGKAALATSTIKDHLQDTWRMQPNRKIMPSRWVVTDPGQNIAMQFDQRILAKMTNPMYRTVLALLDGAGKEVYRLADPRTSIPDRMLGVGPDDWAIMSGDTLVAKLVRLPRQSEPSNGILGKLKTMLTTSDMGIISAGGHHVLPAPVALAMVMLLQELTDTSGG